MTRIPLIPSPRVALSLLSALCCPVLVSCGDSGPVQAGSVDFPAQPAFTTTTSALRVEVRTAPDQPPVRGSSSVELRLFAIDSGEPVDALTLSVVPFMPAMGHGSPDTPSVSFAQDGRYVLDNVVLPMPGVWELRTSISGPTVDYVAPSFDVQ
ncbi:MAG TPA: FixH family protein [Polyangiaceae bacterium]|jgi:hypothetical protein